MYQDKGRNISFSKSALPNKFLYNGKEYDANTGYYQYGFRQYDAAIGRWHVIDAFSEKYYSTSPYAYVLGNPVGLLDVLGLSAAAGYSTSDPTEIIQILNYAINGGNINYLVNAIGNAEANGTGGSFNGYVIDYTDDNYFTPTGSFLGYAENGTSSIRILNTPNAAIPAGFYLNQSIKLIDSKVGLANSLVLSKAYNTGLINDQGVENIFRYYFGLKKSGLPIVFDDPGSNSSKLMGFRTDNGINSRNSINPRIVVFTKNWVDGTINNYNNILSTFNHELAHFEQWKQNPIRYTYETHIFDKEQYASFQATQKTEWKYASENYQMGQIQYWSQNQIQFTPRIINGFPYHVRVYYNRNGYFYKFD